MVPGWPTLPFPLSLSATGEIAKVPSHPPSHRSQTQTCSKWVKGLHPASTSRHLQCYSCRYPSACLTESPCKSQIQAPSYHMPPHSVRASRRDGGTSALFETMQHHPWKSLSFGENPRRFCLLKSISELGSQVPLW